jgi:hypothetical protein
LRKLPKAKGGQPSKKNWRLQVTSSLKANGITKNQSANWQKLAAVPEKQFEAANRQIATALGIDEKTVRNDAAENSAGTVKKANKNNEAKAPSADNSAPVITGAVAAKLLQRKERVEEQREESARARRREQQRRHR